VWNKGLSHIAGNANSKSLRQLPIVTELCVQYVKKPIFRVGNQSYSMKDWLRHEWVRTGLPFSKTNEAAGVKNAATRKYFTKCHLWYSPPSEVFEKISLYANKHGEVVNKPFFAVDGRVLSKKDWDELRAKFKCPIGVTNVWNIPPLNGKERVKKGNAALHLNQKPLEIMKLILEISSDEGDVCWEPFGGLCSAAIAAHRLSRYCHAAEINKEIFDAAVERFKKEEEASNESTK
jgi:site-specific DNA-methyltransferase (adenine-specific)